MKERFEGPDGHRSLMAVILEQRVVEHDKSIAEILISKGALVEFQEGDTVIEQGAADTETYFLVSGEANVFVNNRQVGVRGPRDLVGEMVTLEPAAPRSATVKASGDLVALRIAAADLETVADQYPSIWRAIGRVLTERLRERSPLPSAPKRGTNHLYWMLDRGAHARQ